MPASEFAVFPPVIAAVFAAIGLVHLAAPQRLVAVLARLGYGGGFHRAIGGYALLTALFLAIPLTRIWGVAFAAFFLFAGIVGLLHHRRYMTAMPGMLLLAALPFVLAAGAW